jgi:hypothetical protein
MAFDTHQQPGPDIIELWFLDFESLVVGPTRLVRRRWRRLVSRIRLLWWWIIFAIIVVVVLLLRSRAHLVFLIVVCRAHVGILAVARYTIRRAVFFVEGRKSKMRRRRFQSKRTRAWTAPSCAATERIIFDGSSPRRLGGSAGLTGLASRQRQS